MDISSHYNLYTTCTKEIMGNAFSLFLARFNIVQRNLQVAKLKSISISYKLCIIITGAVYQKFYPLCPVIF